MLKMYACSAMKDITYQLTTKLVQPALLAVETVMPLPALFARMNFI